MKTARFIGLLSDWEGSAFISLMGLKKLWRAKPIVKSTEGWSMHQIGFVSQRTWSEIHHVFPFSGYHVCTHVWQMTTSFFLKYMFFLITKDGIIPWFWRLFLFISLNKEKIIDWGLSCLGRYALFQLLSNPLNIKLFFSAGNYTELFLRLFYESKNIPNNGMLSH